MIMARKNIEDAIQIQLILWLEREHSQVEYYYNKNEGKKNIITAMMDKRKGQIAGRPDLDLWLNHNNCSYTLHLELKTKDGSLNPAQKLWHSKFISTKNRITKVAYGFIEAQEVVRNWLSSVSENK
jgi:hypothetical protein